MKRTLLTIAAIATVFASLTGCRTASLVHPRIVGVGFADFRPYISSGFWISPDPYTGKYEPVGELLIRVYPEIQEKTNGDDGVYYSTEYQAEKVDASELLELAYKEAKKRGANGIANYKTQIQGNGLTETYTVTGLLINTLD